MKLKTKAISLMNTKRTFFDEYEKNFYKGKDEENDGDR